eukprot:5782351-Prymnesium_polylepis.1
MSAGPASGRSIVTRFPHLPRWCDNDADAAAAIPQRTVLPPAVTPQLNPPCTPLFPRVRRRVEKKRDKPGGQAPRTPLFCDS